MFSYSLFPTQEIKKKKLKIKKTKGVVTFLFLKRGGYLIQKIDAWSTFFEWVLSHTFVNSTQRSNQIFSASSSVFVAGNTANFQNLSALHTQHAQIRHAEWATRPSKEWLFTVSAFARAQDVKSHQRTVSMVSQEHTISTN